MTAMTSLDSEHTEARNAPRGTVLLEDKHVPQPVWLNGSKGGPIQKTGGRRGKTL